MGATTTQGTGPGSADRKSSSLDMTKFIGPKVSSAGSVILDGESGTRSIATVIISALIGSFDDYVIILTGTTSGAAYVCSPLCKNGNCWEFKVCGDSGSKIYWAVIKSGF